MTSRLLFATLLTTLVLSSACAGLRVHTDAYVDIAYRQTIHRRVPTPPCQWVWVSSYWETGWICVPAWSTWHPRTPPYAALRFGPSVVEPPRHAPAPRSVPRTHPSSPSVAVPRGGRGQNPNRTTPR